MAILQAPWTTQTNGIKAPIGNYSDSDLLRIPYVESEMPYLNEGSALFWKLLSMIPVGEEVDQPRFEFFEDTKFDTHVKSTTGYDDSATTIVVDSALVIPNMALYNARTKEVLYVTAATGTSLTVTRGWGNAAAAILEDDVLIILGANLPEGGNANRGVLKTPTKDYNYVMFFSETISETDVQKMTNMRYNVGKVAGSYTDTYNKLIEQMDNALRYGVRKADTSISGDGTVYSSGGFINTCGQEINVPAGFTYADLCDLFNPMYEHSASSSEKILLCGQGVLNKLIALQEVREQVHPVTYNPVIGATVTTINLSGSGILRVVVDKMGFSIDRGLTNSYFIIDPKHIKQRPFKGFADIVSRDVSQPESHTIVDEMYGCVGMQMTHKDDVHAYGAFLAV
jgi:hypothetical protein